MILAFFAFFLGLSGVISFSFFTSEGEKLWNWVILFLGLAFPFIAARYIEFPEGYVPADGSFWKQMIIYLMESAFTSHLVFLFVGLVLGVLWVLHQEGTLNLLGQKED